MIIIHLMIFILIVQVMKRFGVQGVQWPSGRASNFKLRGSGFKLSVGAMLCP